MLQRLQKLLLASACGLIAALAAAPTRGDVLLLYSGGRVEGRWLNAQEPSPASYLVELPGGGQIAVRASQVQQVIPQTPEQLEFQRIAPTFADTIEEQWRLAEWCREQGLTDERRMVLERVLQLDPDHAEARRGMGYSQVGGQWLTREQWAAERGYRMYRGRLMLPQEIELIEERRRREIAEKEWSVKLTRWRQGLASDKPRDVRAAYEQICAIDDPLAVRAIAEQLARERFRPVRLLYTDVLAQIGSGPALRLLIHLSLNDLDAEIRAASVDRIVELKPPGAVDAYVQALKDPNNVRVNLAAQALRRLEDPSAIGPLIDALVTTHEIVLRPSNRSPDTVTTTFDSSNEGFGGGNPTGGTGLTAGDTTRVIRRTVPNQEVLAALVSLTRGVNFSFDAAAWRYWYEAERQRAQPAPSLRD